MRFLPPIGSRRTGVIILVNVALNAAVGFSIFARAFCDKNFGFASIAGNLLFSGMVLGIPSGAALKLFRVQDVVFSVLPLLWFFALFIGGSIEKGGPKDIALAFLVFIMPLVFQGGSWWLGVFVSRRRQK